MTMNQPRVRARELFRTIPSMLLVLAASMVFPACGASLASDNTRSQQELIILGASYAASWGTPALPGYGVVNRGVGGQQTRDMRARFQSDVVAARPDAVLIWGHINNITQSDIATATSVQAEAVKKATRADYLAMLQQARAADIDVILATEIPLAEPQGVLNQIRALIGKLLGKQSYADKVNAQVRDLNAFVRQLAAKEKLRLLDFERVFAPGGGARKADYAAADRSHITAAGYAALTDHAAAELGRQR